MSLSIRKRTVFAAIAGILLAASSALADSTPIALHRVSLQDNEIHITHADWEYNVWVYRIPEYIVLDSGRGETQTTRIEQNPDDGSIILAGVRLLPNPAEYTFVLRGRVRGQWTCSSR